MLRIVLVSLWLFQSCLTMAQIRLTKLVLEKNEKFFIEGTDILVTDTLIMRDSSSIVLNPQKKDNFIHSKVTMIGKGCVISGSGPLLKQASEGIAATDQSGPCSPGRIGGNGSPGSQGNPANNLSVYFTELHISGSLTINLNGGDGGDGGDGGLGGGGGPGTRLCAGGAGGNGGNGGDGGNGADGGTLSIECKNCPSVRGLIGNSIIVKNYGGYAGLGGEGGIGGPGGLGPIKDGLNGKRGKKGKDGLGSKNGVINFLSN